MNKFCPWKNCLIKNTQEFESWILVKSSAFQKGHGSTVF